MKCSNCGATVLKGDQTCKKCGTSLIEATEVYAADTIYRSRFALLYRAWLGSFSGWHLKWLGYPEEAKRIKAQYGMGLSSIFNLGNMFASIVYQCVECSAVMFGKYREDANGHPVRYFNPNKKKK